MQRLRDNWLGRKKHTDIPMTVKYKVGDRDHWECIICGAPGGPVCHVVNRSQGGRGIEQNIVTLCHRCHEKMDNGAGGKVYRQICERYLKQIYPGWTRDSVIYDKWEGMK